MTVPEGLTAAEYQEIVTDAAASAELTGREHMVGLAGLALVLLVLAGVVAWRGRLSTEKTQ